MKRLARLLHPGREWDDHTKAWVPRGWIAERQRLVDESLLVRPLSGTCLDCGRPIEQHPQPERMWRSGPDLCAAAAHSDGTEGA